MLAQSVVRSFDGKVAFVVENYGDSELARRFGVTRYPAIFVDDILVAKPKDFGFYGKGEGGGDGRYTPWKEPSSHERFRTDLKRMIEIALAGNGEQLRKERAEDSSAAAGITHLPSLQLKDLAGNAVTAKDLAGRPVLVEFWATWCPPCRGTLGWLGELKKKYGNKLIVLAVAIESDEEEVRKVVASANLPLRWAMGSPELARSFGDVSAVPTLFLFDSKGNAVDVFYGAPPDLHEKAEQAITSVQK